VTVADAQGLRDYAAPSLCQRLSLTSAALHHARQARLTRGWGASQRPLYQVFAWDAAPSEATLTADDAPVDLQAVCTRLWEVLA
jgi:hypothetical protein